MLNPDAGDYLIAAGQCLSVRGLDWTLNVRPGAIVPHIYCQSESKYLIESRRPPPLGY